MLTKKTKTKNKTKIKMCPIIKMCHKQNIKIKKIN